MILTSVSQDTNYIVLDEASRIVYTASFISSGYGTRIRSYHSPSYDSVLGSLFKSGQVIVLEGMRGYEVQTAGYAQFVSEVSNGEIKVEDAYDPNASFVPNWNSIKNGYLNDDIGITFVSGGETMNYRNKEPFRLSSIFDSYDENGQSAYLMEVPYSDSYEIVCPGAAELKVTDINGAEIKKDSASLYTFHKGEKVAVSMKGGSFEPFNLSVKAKNHLVELPYEVLKGTSISSYDVQGDKSVDPLTSSQIKVAKRDDGKGLYINCNNPEALYEDCLNTVLTGQDVSGKEVFFTYEHNNKITRTYYYGYRVTNTGDTDIFVTVKNLGNQIKGDGSWLGENEWIQFYNLPFRVKDLDKLSASQKKNFDAYVGFSNEYQPEVRQPITYRIPKGKYIYVMGGTTKDAYKNINVFGSADEQVSSSISGCSNGAVLFEVTGGKAFGQFMAYSDPDASTINETPYVKEHKQYGYVMNIVEGGETHFTGSQYAGYEPVHGVVDTNAEWIINDKTAAGPLPVTYRNNYYSNKQKGEPFGKVTDVVGYENKKVARWITHINPTHTPNAVGTDMTKYITTNHETGEPIVIEAERYDGTGSTANIGNWMVDYIDTITLVNQGDKERELTYKMSHNGVILAFVRDENGNISPSYPLAYQTRINGSAYGAAIDIPFSYTIKIAPHSVARFSVDYNLLANSSGYITHEVTIK